MDSRLEQLHGDITTLAVDAIVNAANSALAPGGGVDGAIRRAAGPGLNTECAALGGCETGQAKLTAAYNLPCRKIIHTVGPIWQGGDADEDRLLASCYGASLKLAADAGLKSIAFPAISTGIFGFPSERAAAIAVREARAFLNRDDRLERVIFVSFSAKDFAIMTAALSA